MDHPTPSHVWRRPVSASFFTRKILQLREDFNFISCVGSQMFVVKTELKCCFGSVWNRWVMETQKKKRKTLNFWWFLVDRPFYLEPKWMFHLHIEFLFFCCNLTSTCNKAKALLQLPAEVSNGMQPKCLSLCLNQYDKRKNHSAQQLVTIQIAKTPTVKLRGHVEYITFQQRSENSWAVLVLWTERKCKKVRKKSKKKNKLKRAELYIEGGKKTTN